LIVTEREIATGVQCDHLSFLRVGASIVRLARQQVSLLVLDHGAWPN